MYKRFTLLAISLWISTVPLAVATDSDFSKPIKVDSKSQFVDGKNKTSLFKEDVRITQGTLVIDAEEVEVIASQGEGREIFVARGNPASYSQKMEDGATVNARANEIRYEVDKRTISLNGSAELRQNTSMVRGDKITYDMATEQLLATGEDGEGRVTTVFQPEAVKKLTQDSEKDSDDNNVDKGEDKQ
ncbi:lipopolysaccharide transport periplasmic protein LptA [Alteromonas halophila]|uniref:Lipopolysaccharide export system protein LptA n=1 Tax=Alteromonas halophila TaxID=516698 RepID=A0A918JHV5_9ALTE|nr:lipopolysaccharide transport periplasmic protein LptA [Alteromonas halophila]GGW80953.1 lipopolysaccharide export system protein LptA [Alteromonas halophila]